MNGRESNVGTPTGARRLCVFCGEKPTNKNVEHVVPKWLLEMTGKSNRMAAFAPVWNDREQKLGVLKIPFSKFVFPACSSCNERFSELEGLARRVVDKMLSHEPICAHDLGTLLSWLDKVRTGLWLAYYYLQRNFCGIDPHMAIAERVDRADRLVFLYRSIERVEGVSIVGANSPAFQYLPVCFGLVVNDLGFLNASTDFLLARRLGLPHGTAECWGEWPGVIYTLEPPRERVMLPVLRGYRGDRCTRVFQPMAGREVTLRHLEKHCESATVQAIFGKPPSPSGKVLIQDGKEVREYGEVPTMEWLPPADLSRRRMAYLIFEECTRLQLRIARQGPGTKGLTDERRRIVKAQNRLVAAVSRDMVERCPQKGDESVGS
jgi:hypothetical protein